MKYYIDDYRGFSNTIIDLKNVNFLVGENSTGKSSLITAITILSEFKFWMDGNIQNELFDLGTYEDIHSANNNRSYFTLGIIDDDNSNKNFHVISFINEKGLPRAFQDVLFSNDFLMIINIDDNKIAYRYFEKYQVDDENTIGRVLDFIEGESIKKFPEKELKLNGAMLNTRIPLSIFRQIVQTQDKKLAKLISNKKFITDVFAEGVTFIAPIRAKPLPLYSGSKSSFSSEGSHAPFILKEALSRNNENIDILREFGFNSGLFDDIEAFIYGDKEVAPFELLVRKGNNKFKISSVGYGVSQVLPIIVEFVFTNRPVIMIQQPEVHLHPKAQAAFGEFLFKMMLKNPKRKMIIETHSDYIIDRFRFLLKTSKKNIKSQVCFTKNISYKNSIQYIGIGNDGKYAAESDLSEFRSFFIDESFKIMEI